MSVYVSKAAKFYDGKTGDPKNVSLLLTGSTLQISKDEQILESWSLNKVVVIDHPAPPVPGIFGHHIHKDARLYIDDQKEWKFLYDRLPKSAKKTIILPSHWSSFFFYIMAAIISIIFLFLMFPKIIEQSAYLIPAEIERSIGKQAISSIIGSRKACVNQSSKLVLDKVFQKLKEQTSRDIDYEIHVVKNSYMPNAFAAPGGYIIIFSAVINRAKSPEEVVGVLAHEMAHIDLYHSTKGLMRGLGLKFALSLIFGSSTIEDLASFFSQMSYSRRDESEADMHGRTMMVKAGIDPKGMRKFFENLKNWEESFFSEKDYQNTIRLFPFLEYLSTHPDTIKRIKELRSLENETQFSQALNQKEWQNLKNICDQTKALVLK